MFLCLFEPDIPQNTGSMIRLCACLGLELHIIEPCGFPLDDKKLKRVAMDYGDHVIITRHRSWKAFLELYQVKEKRRLVLLTTQATKNYTDFSFQEDDIVLLGRESSGVPDTVHKAVDHRIGIKTQAGTRSLNLVQAASMVAGEAIRQMTVSS